VQILREDNHYGHTSIEPHAPLIQQQVSNLLHLHKTLLQWFCPQNRIAPTPLYTNQC
jgi:hypothetical protein